MNPKPSLIQALVLHDINDDGVWFDLATGRWHSTHIKNDVTTQINILHRDGYIHIDGDLQPQVVLTDAGFEVLERRPLGDLVEKINGGR